jgi:hypothetical protein
MNCDKILAIEKYEGDFIVFLQDFLWILYLHFLQSRFND